MAQAQQRNRQQLVARQRRHPHAGTSRHQAQADGAGANAVQHRQAPGRRVQAGEIDQQAAERGDDQRVAGQCAQEVRLPVARHGPHCRDVHQRHAAADQHRDLLQAGRARQPLGQRQTDEGIEAKRHLRPGRVLAPVDMAAQPWQPGQQVGQRNRTQAAQQAGTEKARAFTEHQRAFDDGVEQQDRKQQVVHQPLHRLPDAAVQRRQTAQRKADQDQRKVGEQQAGVVHGRRRAYRCGAGRSGSNWLPAVALGSASRLHGA